MSDEEIMRLFECDEERAFRMLVKKYSEKLYWHIRKIVLDHEDSNDILQNSFMKIWKGIHEFRHESKLYVWMYRIATNEAISFLHEKQRKVYGHTEEISELLANQLEGDIYFCGDAIQEELQKIILRLPERQRLVFNMKYYDDMKYEDMANILNVAVGTLKATYHAAVKKVEEGLKVSDILNFKY